MLQHDTGDISITQPSLGLGRAGGCTSFARSQSPAALWRGQSLCPQRRPPAPPGDVGLRSPKAGFQVFNTTSNQAFAVPSFQHDIISLFNKVDTKSKTLQIMVLRRNTWHHRMWLYGYEAIKPVCHNGWAQGWSSGSSAPSSVSL